MDYGKIVARAFEITRKHRALWLFGILLALFGGGGGGGSGNFNIPSGGDNFPRLPTLSSEVWQIITILIIALVCFAVIWLVLSIILRFVSRAALIGLVQELEAEQKAPTVGRGFSIGAEHFWRLLGIALVINIPLAIISLVIVIIALLPLLMAIAPLISAGRSAPSELIAVALSGGAISILLICCAALFLFALNLVIVPFYQFITRACVIQKLGVMDSIRAGYHIVRANLGKVAVLYILAIGISIGFGIVILIVTLLFFAIIAGVGFAVYAVVQSEMPALIVAGIVAIPVILVLIFVSGLYATFESTYWTLGYRAVTTTE
ncbi:MAG: hypothetical protein N2559_03990 [Anaerolineae bacterium]|nr:hypothetical protein [Anaerolineae bacterium]